MKTFRAFAVAAVLGTSVFAASAASAAPERTPVEKMFCWVFPEICEGFGW